MMIQPLVSFVIPVFNSENDIARCLLAIGNLQCPKEDYDLVIMDNGSTDHTHQIMLDLGFDFQVVPKVNVSALRNRGAALARGQYLAFIDSDVELSPHWLQKALEGFADPLVVACGCFPRVPKSPSWVQKTWDLHQRGRRSTVQLAPTLWLPSMNIMVRRNDFLSIAGFNEHLETTEDVDLCYRLAQRGTILCNPGMEAIHWGEAQDLRTFWRKEVWRGLGNLKGILSHGFRWDELPSLGYPLYMLMATLLCIVSLHTDLRWWRLQLLPFGLFALTLPSVCLALNTAYKAQSIESIPRLFVLYFIYGLSRAYSIVKTCMPSFVNRKR